MKGVRDMNEIKMGDRFYDDRNGRYLTVDAIDSGSKTVMCVVEEIEEEDFTVTGRQLFNINELRHFNKEG